MLLCMFLPVLSRFTPLPRITMGARYRDSWSVLLTYRLESPSIWVLAKSQICLRRAILHRIVGVRCAMVALAEVRTLEFQPCPSPRVRFLPGFVVCLPSRPHPCGSSSRSNPMPATSPHSGSARFADSSHLATNHVVWNVGKHSKQLKVRG